MEFSHNEEAANLNVNVYPESVNEVKTVINPQALLWAIIAVVLYVIYRQQPDNDTTLGIVQLTLIIASAVLAIIKLCSGNCKLIYTPTGSPVVCKNQHYRVSLEHDIRQSLKEGNISYINALKTDDAGGLLVETMESKDKVFVAMRMQKYFPEGYKPETEWFVMKK